MSSDDDASHLREQAEYCRLQAQKASGPNDKRAWLKVAGAEARKRDNPS
jgi:hypothetical protein